MSIATNLTLVANDLQGILTDTNTALVAKGSTSAETLSDIPDKISTIPSGSSDINPAWTDWRYFSYYNNRNDLVAKLKYSDTHSGTDFSNMFYGCSRLTEIPAIDTSSGTNFEAMFHSNYINSTIPPLDTSNGTNFRNMFYHAHGVETIQSINFTHATTLSGAFSYCYSLKNITFEGSIPVSITFTGGTIAPLTRDSLLSLLNALIDNSSSGTSLTVSIGASNIAKLTDAEKAIATQKGWTLA